MKQDSIINKYDQELALILNADLKKHFFDIENKAILFLTRKFDEQLADILKEDVQTLKLNNSFYINQNAFSA
jgi:hypothetical protein